MYSNVLSNWALSLISDCLPFIFQNSRFESCVILLHHETKSVFGFDMTGCEIGPVSTPIRIAVQENSFIHSCFRGKVRFLCLQSVSLPVTEFMHEGHHRDQL